MRVLKFRAWDKQQKKMIVVPHLSFGDDGKALTIMIWHKTAEMYDRALVVGETAELMQFTGLLDKNGREVYEGDIVEIKGAYGGKQQVHVLWGKTTPMYEWMCAGTWLLSRFSNGNEGPLYPYCQPSHGFEVSVIGNIYETPELLEVLHD